MSRLVPSTGLDSEAGAAPHLPPLAPGDLVASRYRVLRLLGTGGMGAVYEARDEQRGADVALKVLLPPLFANAEARARFREEGLVLLDLQHDGIVRVYDVALDGERGVSFIVMRRLVGPTLRARLEELRSAGRRMAREEAVAIADDLLDALSYAHLRTVHRDVKPENVILEPDPRRGGRPRAVLLDFGIAKVLDGDRRTRTRAILGTIDYMAPEQIEDSSRVDARADLYAVAAVLYEALTGRPPRGHFKAPGALRPGVPYALDAAVLRGLATAPADRPASAARYREEIAAAMREPPRLAPAPPRRPPEPACRPPQPRPAGFTAGRVARRSVVGMDESVVFCALLCFIVLAVAAMMRGARDAREGSRGEERARHERIESIVHGRTPGPY